MATEIRIPKIGMSATEMTLSEWMFGDGEEVAVGDVIYTVETDKTTSEIEAQASGVLRVIGVEGEIYPVGALVGMIGRARCSLSRSQSLAVRGQGTGVRASIEQLEAPATSSVRPLRLNATRSSLDRQFAV